jgi:hypothetical protein
MLLSTKELRYVRNAYATLETPLNHILIESVKTPLNAPLISFILNFDLDIRFIKMLQHPAPLEVLVRMCQGF